MMLPTSDNSPFRKEDVVYIRAKVVGFEQYIGWNNVGTKDKPKMVAEVRPEYSWVQPIDKDGNPVGDMVHQMPLGCLIHPGAVKQDIRETMEKAE